MAHRFEIQVEVDFVHGIGRGRDVVNFWCLTFPYSSCLFPVPKEPNPQAPTCTINGQQYKDGESSEVLQESADKTSIICQQCKCNAGQHSCHKIFDCDIQRDACERSVKIPGQCCPECGT